MVQNNNPDGWTFASLLKHLAIQRDTDQKHNASLRDDDQRAIQAALASQEKNSAAGLAAQKEAVNKAEASQSKRDEASNNIRGAMMDDRKNYATNEKVEGMDARLGKIENTQSQTAGAQQGAGMSRGQVVTAFGLILTLLSLILGLVVYLSKGN